MRIAMIGTRGVPARYGGFETAIEEIGKRLSAEGHEVVVYCRGGEDKMDRYLGMELHHLPAIESKVLETLSHTFLSVLHVLFSRRKPDVAFVFNAANAVFVPLLWLRRIPTAVHVDGLEWRRAKWGKRGRQYYRMAESLSVRWADALIADADGIAEYYETEFGAPTELIAYGAPIQESPASDLLAQMGLSPQSYHLVVARFEPENHVLEIVRGYVASQSKLPLIVVGSAPYSDDYTAAVEAVGRDDRVQLVGGVWDQDLLDQLYANAASYLHGHSVGGTNPSLLRAMGAGTTVIAWDVSFNRGVLGGGGRFFDTDAGLVEELAQVETELATNRAAWQARASQLQDRARTKYDWDDVANSYGQLAHGLAKRSVSRPKLSGRRR